MSLNRRRFLTGTTALGVVGAGGLPGVAQTLDDVPVESLIYSLISDQPQVLFGTLGLIRQRGGTDLVSSLIFASRFGPQDAGFDETLTALTGETRKGWFDWMLWQEENPQIESHPAYYLFKSNILLQIDQNFDVFLPEKYILPDSMKIRFEEVTWGGVRKDGIPSLDSPRLVSGADADYLADDDLIFGVSINGDVRAYPLRIMGWHEMFNEVIGGVPVALAYCTLCGAGILFETKLGDDDPLIFGSSGFLYRSNKLMFDRKTHSLWNQFTGKPVSGQLVDSGIELKQRPVVITEWKHWKADNPDTKVLSMNTGFLRDYGSGVVYNDYFTSDDLMFPALLKGQELTQKDFVFGVRLAGGAKAWPLTAFSDKKVINDSAGFQNLVLIGDAKTRTVRAYDRGEFEFSEDLMADGATWTMTEDALLAPDGRKAARVAGHVAYWFAWAGYLGDDAEIYDG